MTQVKNLEPLPAKNKCGVFTAEYWGSEDSKMLFTRYDGFGFWATSEGFSYAHNCFKAKPDWATHVVWFNK